ncbi:DUF308 domain-containing protein [Fructilactobacillus fructivorans]|uniref:Putative membrane protein n=1 Tax=Fructilactobacillus fructivorans TaxID=1614 RepID=A0A0C1M7F8_9LACO|nr:DUF308 domain-containing protein [Fructilactobacillus fructivorans]KID42369.1 putative membrane protein [Fructilactobacillus fructivorans]KRK58139.1 hypothetical protein FC73_GL000519 [Fructilactobacillus fructivorans]KRN41371.1 hypothetical protein IV51_GL000697 [Fructilactobacillus fructivorans]KRN42828.1 hypothetical protein IV48_GL001050 [Fructilactobacillus fructivorans]MCT0151014.1 hypothetical protein [Fructilactobacillus fructivorans]
MFNAKEKSFDGWALIAGIIFIAAGIFVFVKPFATLQALAVILGVVALCIGLYHLVLHRQLQKNLDVSSYLVIFNGIIDIIIGLFLLFSESFGFYLIAIAFAIWFIVDSGLSIYSATKAQQKSPKRYYWLIVTAGIIGIIIGIILLFTPYFSNAVVIIFIGIYFIIEGIKLLIMAF